MTRIRVCERADAVAPGRDLRVVGIVLLLVAVVACKTPSFVKNSDEDAAGADAPPVSLIDAKKESSPDGADGAPPPVCPAGGESPSKGKGEACTCDYECRTGHCANGVCCTSSCTDKCKACNRPNSLGDCSFVQAGVAPADPSQCSISDPGTCGQDGKCDGKGGCQLYLAETVCNSGRCEGDGLSGMKTCDGKGNCLGAMSRPCAPYSCDVPANECHGSCTSNTQCAVGQECVSGSCGLKLNGYKCGKDSECASSYCSGGICCNVPCNGPCVSCAITGSFGRCRLVPAGQPDPRCAKRPENTCGTTGLCDGSGTCALWPADTTPCKSATCSGSVLLSTTAVCDGKGTCKDPSLVDCSPYLCAGGQCNRSCKSDGECEPGHACLLGANGSAGTCSGKAQVGQPCNGASECDSGHCVDGVCCESSCEGACRSCALPGSPGRCTNLPTGARDPREVCTDEGALSCGRNGLCDGVGACQLYPADSTKCGVPTCDDHNIFTDAPTCNQAGQCVGPPSRGCDPYACNGNSCLSSCSKNSDCAPPNTCVNSSCGKAPPAADCSSGIECLSGFCAQGVCCNVACGEACSACNLPGRLGLCSAVADGNPDPQEKCLLTSSSGCGTTGACMGGTCAYYDVKTLCQAATCASTSSVRSKSNCDGHGVCVPEPDIPCGSFLCVDNACLATCKTDTDCVPPNTCVNSSCGRKPNGATCTKGEQCGSGFCTEGVCCESACADDTSNSLCMSCKVSGKVGTCSTVPDGQADPKQRCLASNVAAGDCSSDGTCDGRGGCRPWSTTAACRAASCTDSSFTPATMCDGAGHCPAAPAPSLCDPYKCASSTACLTTCKDSTDCVSGETCLEVGHRCGTKQANGQACGANADCYSNICSGEGVCCDSLCTDACKSCTVASHVGTCSYIKDGGSPRNSTICPKGAPCGNTGKCNGAGGCQLAATGTVCGADVCAAPLTGLAIDGSSVTESVALIPASKCDGKGVCLAQSPVSCGAYQCEAGKCKPECTSANADCNSLTPSTTNPTGGYSCNLSTTPGSCLKLADGASCTAGAACLSRNCVDRTCCVDATCDDKLTCTDDTCATSTGECRHTLKPDSCLIDRVCYTANTPNPTNNCQVCDPVKSTSAWSPIGAGTVCRPTAGDCDIAEVCDALGTKCPDDTFLGNSTVCRTSAGDCDIAEACDGSHAACPTDLRASASTVCRAVAGVCDVAETCDGTNVACPIDAFLPGTQICRASAGVCDVAEKCTGLSATCPGDGFAPSAQECRASAGVCDVAEKCTGSSATCPDDALAPSTQECRASVSICDVAENCTGKSTVCPDDGYAPSTKECRASVSICDVAENCTGSSTVCPDDGFAANTVVCRPVAGTCDVAEKCTGKSEVCPADEFLPSGQPCPAPDNCHEDSLCTGSPSCPLVEKVCPSCGADAPPACIVGAGCPACPG